MSALVKLTRVRLKVTDGKQSDLLNINSLENVVDFHGTETMNTDAVALITPHLQT